MKIIIYLAVLLCYGFAHANQANLNDEFRREQSAAINEILGENYVKESYIDKNKESKLRSIAANVCSHIADITKDIVAESMEGAFILTLSYKDKTLTITDIQTQSCNKNEVACRDFARRILNEEIEIKKELSSDLVSRVAKINIVVSN